MQLQGVVWRGHTCSAIKQVVQRRWVQTAVCSAGTLGDRRMSHCQSQIAAKPATPPWQHHLPGNTLTYRPTADLAECGKTVRHSLRNMRPHGGVRVKVYSQVAYGRGGIEIWDLRQLELGPWESDPDIDSSHSKGPPSLMCWAEADYSSSTTQLRPSTRTSAHEVPDRMRVGRSRTPMCQTHRHIRVDAG